MFESLMTIQQACALALRQQRAGQLREAEALLRATLNQQGDHPQLRQALAMLFQQTGRVEEAIEQLQAALRLRPKSAELLVNLGIMLAGQGKFETAIENLNEAVALRPDVAEAHYNLANALKLTGDSARAIASYQKALSLRPDFAPAWNNLGNLLTMQNQLQPAEAALREAIRLRPDHAEAHNNLGLTLKAQSRFDEAIVEFGRATELRPNYAEAWNNLATLLHGRGDYKESLAAVNRAMELKPNFAEAYANLGNTLKAQGDLDGAIAAWDRAIALRPGDPHIEWNLALALLLKGDYERGWPAYESRWKTSDYSEGPYHFEQPRWDGTPLNGRTILVRFEQGFGDIIQFVRFVPRIAERGGKVIALGPPALRRLLAGQFGISQYVAFGEPLPPFDCYTLHLSLPGLFHISVAEASAQNPYLKVDPALVELWKSRIGPAGQAVRVGLVWAGNRNNFNGRNRSVPLAAIVQHLASSGVQFFSLQKDADPTSIATDAPQLQMVDLTSQIDDFADTAALISDLDLVIACDTSVAHLAGAIGKPVWILLPHAPDWRWMLNRTDSIWYPTARLFRQTTPGDWNAPLKEVASQLSELARQRNISSHG